MVGAGTESIASGSAPRNSGVQRGESRRETGWKKGPPDQFPSPLPAVQDPFVMGHVVPLTAVTEPMPSGHPAGFFFYVVFFMCVFCLVP